MAGKKGLGRGIDLLIPKGTGTGSAAAPNVSRETSSAKKKISEEKTLSEKDILFIDINKIEPNREQPRKVFDEDAIEELSESIKQYGVLQPLLVKQKDNYYEIIAGERRWRASKKAGLKEIPVMIKDLSDKDILKISLIENIQREDLNPIEEARAYQILQEDYSLTHDEIAMSVSKSRTAITNIMRLLKLNEEVQKMIMEGIISSGHGRSLLAIEDKDLQYETAVKILDENMSVRETEKYVKKLLSTNGNTVAATETPQNTEMYTFYENRMKEILGSKVQIKSKKNNKGKIEIEYYSQDELERLIDLIQSIH